MRIMIERPSKDGLTLETYDFNFREHGYYGREQLRLSFCRYTQWVRNSRRHKWKQAGVWSGDANAMRNLDYRVQKLERPDIPESVKTEVELRVRNAIHWQEP